MSVKIKKFAFLTFIILVVGIVANNLFMTGVFGHTETFRDIPNLNELLNMSTSSLITAGLSMAIIINAVIKLFKLLIHLFKVLPYMKEKQLNHVETNNAITLFKNAAKNSKCFLLMLLVIMKKFYVCFPKNSVGDSFFDTFEKNLSSAFSHPMMILGILVAVGISIFYIVLKGMFNKAAEELKVA